MNDWALNIEIGGLCMFVRRSANLGLGPGLYVLMPATHHGAVHVPTLEFGEKGQPKSRVAITGKFADLRDLNKTTVAGNLPAAMAPVSKFSGKTVQDKYLADNGPINDLAERIVLPISTSLTTTGSDGKEFDSARMHPENNSVPSQPYYGRVMATISGIDKGTKKFKIGDITIFRPAGAHEVNLRLVNVPEADLDCPMMKPHHAGKYSEHFEHYYNLLAPGGPRPNLIFDDSTPGETVCRDERLANAKAYGSKTPAGDVSIEFVDPFACTTALGCPSEEPDCKT